MQREILRRNWKRFLIQLQKSSDAVSDSPAGMFFSRPHELRWQPAYVQTGRSQRQQGERLRYHGAADEDEQGPDPRVRRSE